MKYFLKTYIVLEVLNDKVLKKNGTYENVVEFFDSISNFSILTNSRGRTGLSFLVSTEVNPNVNFTSEDEVKILNDFYDSEAFVFVKKSSDRFNLFLGSIFVVRSIASDTQEESVKEDCKFIPVFNLPPL